MNRIAPHTLLPYIAGLGVLSLGTALLKSGLNTILMNCAKREDAGLVSGAMDAAEAVCRIVAPLLGE